MASSYIISWGDAATSIRDAEREYNVHITTTLHPSTSVRGDNVFTITIKAVARGCTGRGGEVCTVAGHFPSRRWKSATGAVVGLVYEMSAILEARAADQRAARPLPLWPNEV